MTWRGLIGAALVVALIGCPDDSAQVDSAEVERIAPTARPAGDDTGPEDVTGPTGYEDAATADVSAPPAPPPEPPPAPVVAQARLDAIADAIAAARTAPGLGGHTFGGYVEDLDTGAVIYAEGADRLMIPASNTKILTSAAAVALLGDDHRFVCRVLAADPIDADGVLAGSLHLHGGHDFTWSRWFYADPRVPLDALADRLWVLGLRRVAGPLEIWGAHAYEGHHFGTYSPSSHRARVAAALRAALTDRGIAVDGATVEHATMASPEGATELTRWESLPLHVALFPINRKSHNEMADTLLRHLGWVRGGTSDYATGAEIALAWAAEVGLPDAASAIIGDGSGLDTSNRLTARQLIALYRVILGSPHGPAWLASLSIAGAEGPASNSGDDAVVTTLTTPYMGTLAYRMTAPGTAGRTFGKSGTNAGITTTGVLFNRYDGRRYAFALQMNGITSGQYTAARAAQDAMVEAFAGDLLDAGPRPDAPTLERVVARPDGAVVAHWSPVDAMTAGDGESAGYFVYPSPDGRVFPASERVFVVEAHHALALTDGADRVCARVTAVSAAGESDPSGVLCARPDPDAARVLLVDGNDRWRRQPANENPMGAAHAFVVAYAEALDAVAFDSVANEAVVEGDVALASYDAVLWDVGEESWEDETFDAAEQTLVAAYLGGGGRLLVAGAEIAWDLDARGYAGASADDTAFLEGWLRTGYGGDDAGVFVSEPVPGGIFDGLDAVHFYTPGAMFVAYPEVLEPLDGADAALLYPTWAGATGVAAIAYAGDYRLVHLGFPLAAVGGLGERVALLDRILLFFGL